MPLLRYGFSSVNQVKPVVNSYWVPGEVWLHS
jgi:hypothetical protein